MKDKNATAEKRLSYTPLSVIALLFALAAGSLEAVLMLRYFEPYITASTGEELFCFFSVDTVLPTVLYIVSAAAAAIIVIFGFIAQRRAPEPDERPSSLTGLSVFTGLVCGFALAAATVFFALGMYRSGTLLLFNKPVDVVTAALIICAVPAALYFIVVSFGGYKKPAVAVLGSFAVLWVALLLLRLYFTMNLSLRSPTRILGQLAPIGIMLYLVQELRYRVGAKRAALFRVMAAVALIAIALDTAMTAVLLLKWGISDTHLPFKAVELCIGVYIAVNMFYLPAGIKFSAALHIDEKKRALKELRRVREDREADAYLRDLMEDAGDINGEDAYAAHGMTEEESAESVREHGYTGGYIDLGGDAFGTDDAAAPSGRPEQPEHRQPIGTEYSDKENTAPAGNAEQRFETVGTSQPSIETDDATVSESSHFDCPDEPELSGIPHWMSKDDTSSVAPSNENRISSIASVPDPTSAVSEKVGQAKTAFAEVKESVPSETDTASDASAKIEAETITEDIDFSDNQGAGHIETESIEAHTSDLPSDGLIDSIINTEITPPSEQPDADTFGQADIDSTDIAAPSDTAFEPDMITEDPTFESEETDGKGAVESEPIDSEAGRRIAGYQSAFRRSLIDSISGSADTDAVRQAEPETAAENGITPQEAKPDEEMLVEGLEVGGTEDSVTDGSGLDREFDLLRGDEEDEGFDSSSDMY